MDLHELNELALPEDTQKILNEFLREKAEREREEQEQIQTVVGKEAKFEEDWQLSQFWYSEATKKSLLQVVQKLVTGIDPGNYKIALLSCPSLYGTIKDVWENVNIFEYDRRFAAYGEDFIWYDFNEAGTEDYLNTQQCCYDLIIADPPFLSEECITKMADIIRNLQKPGAKVIFCSGEVVAPWLQKCLALHQCKFRPEHERNLGNEFVSFANFNLDAYMT